jgi:hypothetical protein
MFRIFPLDNNAIRALERIPFTAVAGCGVARMNLCRRVQRRSDEKPSPHSRATGVDGRGGSNGLRAFHSRHHIHLPAATLAADQPLAPIGHRGFGAVPSSRLCRVGLDLVLTVLAPDDEPHIGRRCGAERRRTHDPTIRSFYILS